VMLKCSRDDVRQDAARLSRSSSQRG
jgi:hypothetical protein